MSIDELVIYVLFPLGVAIALILFFSFAAGDLGFRPFPTPNLA